MTYYVVAHNGPLLLSVLPITLLNKALSDQNTMERLSKRFSPYNCTASNFITGMSIALSKVVLTINQLTNHTLSVLWGFY